MKLEIWKKLSNSVFEMTDGRRLHMFGTCRLPDGRIVSAQYSDTWRFIKISGGNRKRGLMAWAQSL